MLPLQSLSAATATGPGAVLDTGTVAQYASIHIFGSNTDFQVNLEGSLDGTDWAVLANESSATGIFPVTTLARYFRANLISISGSGSVSAWVAAKVDLDT